MSKLDRFALLHVGLVDCVHYLYTAVYADEDQPCVVLVERADTGVWAVGLYHLSEGLYVEPLMALMDKPLGYGRNLGVRHVLEIFHGYFVSLTISPNRNIVEKVHLVGSILPVIMYQ